MQFYRFSHLWHNNNGCKLTILDEHKKQANYAASFSIFFNEKVTMQPISVINEDFDTSLTIPWVEIERKINRECSIAIRNSPGKPTRITIPTGISHKKAVKDFVCQLPQYSPPSHILHSSVRNIYSALNYSMPPPTKPKVPVAKTNTHLLTYTHRLYVYRAYMKEEALRKQSIESANLKKYFNQQQDMTSWRRAKKLRFANNDV